LAAEVCRYAGTTDYDGKVSAVSDIATTNGLTRVAVTVTADAVWLGLFRVHYLLEEISTWHGEVLQDVAVNSRYLFDGSIVRQQWDDFERDGADIQARRVQGKTLDDFRRHHPGFVHFWDPAAFGHPWREDYSTAKPERRADLDLTGAAATARTPLAMAFYWIRRLPPGPHDATVFFPGFKKDKTAELHLTPAVSDGETVWQAPLHYPSFSKHTPSSGTATVSADGHLLSMTADLHGKLQSARGQIGLAECEGTLER
jgi:hypothetical protein